MNEDKEITVTIDDPEALENLSYLSTHRDLHERTLSWIVGRAIMRYTERKKSAWEYRTSRKAKVRRILSGQGWCCAYCERPIAIGQATLDHIQPRALGGSVNDTENLVVVCEPCNTAKSDMTKEEYSIYLGKRKVWNDTHPEDPV